MQKHSFILLFLLLQMSMSAQQFSFEYGKVISSFDYKNSEGKQLENLQGSTNNHLKIGFELPIKQSNFLFLSGVFYNKYSANGSDNAVGNYYDWAVNYVGVSVGFGYEFLKLKSQLNFKNSNMEEGFTFTVFVEGGPEFFVQGTQTINNQVFDLNGVEQFDKPLIFAKGGIIANYYATRSVSVFAKYAGGKSFSVFKSEEDQEQLNFITHTISLGLRISLPFFK